MTFKPTFEFYLLTNRIGDGDVTAIPEIWPLMFGEPLDISRDTDEILNDFTTKMKELFPPKEDPTPAERIESLNITILETLESLIPGITKTLGVDKK